MIGTDKVTGMARLPRLLKEDAGLAARFREVRAKALGVRASEYHITNACDIRCQGCWFFENDFDKKSKEVRELEKLKEFVRKERARGINSALLIGGEPALFPARIAAYVEVMDYVSISSNGLTRLPMEGFERVSISLTLFGGGPLDDLIRGRKPSGTRFTGLLDKVLENYADDPRALFVYAIADRGIEHIEPTIKKLRAANKRVFFNFYSQYDTSDPLRMEHGEKLLAEALRMKELYPETVMSHPYFLRTLLTGKTEWGTFGYETCPSQSIDHPAHTERRKNGHPMLPFFNSWAADLTTVQFCCTSGKCDACRDSQAMTSWLLVSLHQFTGSLDALRTWVELAESYFDGFAVQGTSTSPGATTPSAALTTSTP